MSASGTQAATVWRGGVVQVKVPLPFSLKWVNSYLLPDETGYTVVDPGLHTPEAVQTWRSVLSEHGIRHADIHTIVLTHQHPDHYGLAGFFQQQCGSRVLISKESYAYTQRLWGQERTFAEDLVALYARHGMPQPLLDQIGPHLESFVEKVSPQPAVTFIEPGETVRMGALDWLAIDAPGHASGQLMFYAAERRWMICGDQVLPDITPNISVVPGEEGDPLERFLESLAGLARYDVELAFPGHREPMTGFAARASELIGHHHRRLEAMVRLLEERSCTGYEMCERLFGTRIGGNTHNLRFAMSETLAHLFHLLREGRIGCEARGGTDVFTAL